MICYKCDVCGDIHYSLGEMNSVKISYAGKANVTFPCNGEFVVCEDCTHNLLRILTQTMEKVKKETENDRL